MAIYFLKDFFYLKLLALNKKIYMVYVYHYNLFTETDSNQNIYLL